MKLLILSVLLLLSSCSTDDNPIDCTPTVISEDQYSNAASDTFDFAEIKLATNGCLKISVNYGGGCGEVSAVLIGSGDILESDPAQRNLRLLFSDNDDCEALKKQDFYFNIENLKVEDANKVLLNFQDTDLTFLYEY